MEALEAVVAPVESEAKEIISPALTQAGVMLL